MTLPGAPHVDCFSSDLADKQHGNADAVLAEIRRGGRFSVFEMTEKLNRTLAGLVAAGRVEKHPEPYPWLRFTVKDAPVEPGHS